jgi:hypothetical protein
MEHGTLEEQQEKRDNMFKASANYVANQGGEPEQPPTPNPGYSPEPTAPPVRETMRDEFLRSEAQSKIAEAGQKAQRVSGALGAQLGGKERVLSGALDRDNDDEIRQAMQDLDAALAAADNELAHAEASPEHRSEEEKREKLISTLYESNKKGDND